MKISVIVPVFNVEQYLEECLYSLVAQTEAFDEIILVNDGSTDNSLNICKKYCKKYPHIILIDQRNHGQGIARNRGLNAAIGDYVIFVDSDDYISLDTNQILKKELQIEQIDVLFYNATVQYDIKFDAKSTTYIHDLNMDYRVMSGKDFIKISFPQDYTVSACVAAYKRSFLNQNSIRFPERIYFEDNYFNLQVVTTAERIKCIPNELYCRRYRENSTMTSKMSDKKCHDAVKSQQLMWNYLEQQDVWNGEQKFIRRFVAYHVLAMFSGHFLIYENVPVNEEALENFLYLFLEKWLQLFLVEDVVWGEKAAFLNILQHINCLHSEKQIHVVNTYFKSEREFDYLVAEVVRSIRQSITEKVQRVPLNQSGVKIGIYGTGKHTAVLLDFYEKNIGDINCELVFVVSSKQSEKYMGLPVYEVEEIPADMEKIVISSRVYQQEMEEALIAGNVGKEKHIKLYSKIDICDLVLVSDLLVKLEKSACKD